MFTVKVTKRAVDEKGERISGRFCTKMVEGSEVNVFVLRPGELQEVAGTGPSGCFAFYVANPQLGRPEGFADEVDFWDSAFIENSAGKTTETVRF